MKKVSIQKLTILFLLIACTTAFAQRRNRYKYEIVYMAGATNFLGDLGGADKIGTHGLSDFDVVATRPVIGVGYRYKLNNYLSFRGNFFMGIVDGKDENTAEFFRKNRNLSFMAPFLELSVQGELYFIREKRGPIYRINNVRQPRKTDFTGYVFTGVGVTYFNPMAEYQGSYHSLRTLGTEGQGIKPGTSFYTPFTLVVPLGIALKYNIDRRWSVGLEYGIRYTFTDYMDDVGGEYYDNAAIAQAYGPIAAALADRALKKTNSDGSLLYTSQGEKRGDSKYNDAYMFATLSLNYKILFRKKTRSKF